MRQLVIAVDFDGCLIEKMPDPLGKYTFKPFAEDVIRKYADKGCIFVLNTSRYGRYYYSVRRFLKRTSLPIVTKRRLSKISADIYIDDCNIFCKGIDWIEIDKELERRLNETREQTGD